MLTVEERKNIIVVYDALIRAFDRVLIGQKNIKDAVAAALLCTPNSKVLFASGTGYGKSTLSDYLASGFNAERIEISSDMMPSEIQEQLKDKRDMKFLQLEEFNRASARTQNAFINLFEEQKMTIDGKTYSFSNFYVFATQNNSEISGIFNVPQAIYDRFDLCLYFDELTYDERKELYFGNFTPSKKFNVNLNHLYYAQNIIENYQYTDADIDILMQVFDLIRAMDLDNSNLFSGSNARADLYAKKLATLSSIINGRNVILPSDIAKYIKYLYMHRIDQNVGTIGSQDIINTFSKVEDNILSLKRKDGRHD